MKAAVMVVWGMLALGLVVCASTPAWAQCPLGKQEILVITPSGKDKVLCVPKLAVPGLENAADHSEGTVIPASCPCFSPADLDAAAPIEEVPPLYFCKFKWSCPVLPGYEYDAICAWNSSLGLHFLAGFCVCETCEPALVRRECAVYTSGQSDEIRYSDLSAEEVDACLALLRSALP